MRDKKMKLAGAFTASLLLAACGSTGEGGEAADDFPTEDVDVIIPFDPGGGSDVMARMVERYWSDQFGTGMNFQYRSGAAGDIGMLEVARSTVDDGHQIATYNFPHIALRPTLGAEYSPDDFQYIGEIARDFSLLVVPSESEYESVEDFLADAEENPGERSISIAQPLNSEHVAYMKLVEQTGMDVPLVTYQSGSEQAAGILGGEVDAALATTGTMLSGIEADDVRVLAVLSAERLEAFPDWPTLEEQGYPIESFIGRLWLTPPGVDGAKIDRYRDGFAAIAENQDFIDEMANLGYQAGFRDGDSVQQMIQEFDAEDTVERIQGLDE